MKASDGSDSTCRWIVHARWRSTSSASRCRASRRANSGSAIAQGLPALPDSIKTQGKVRVGVRCDQPPYGYQDQNGQFAGVEVDMARQIATFAFGSPDKAELTCVTAENRIPQLNSKRVDLLIATLGISPERARVVDFTKPYRW